MVNYSVAVSLVEMEYHSRKLRIDSQSGTLLCDMKCMIIGLFGDEQAPWVTAVHKSKPIGSFLPGVREDVDKIQILIKKDPSKILAYSVVDFPRERCLRPILKR